jgi:hypothetical protein
MKVVPRRIMRKANPDDIQVILAFDTESSVPGRDHFILDEYENQALYSWFLEHELNEAIIGSFHPPRLSR